MKRLVRFKDRLAKDLKNKTVKRAFDREEIFAELAIQIANIRQSQGLSQKELAKKLNTTQQTVSRLESTDNTSFSISTLIKIAEVLHKKVKIELI